MKSRIKIWVAIGAAVAAATIIILWVVFQGDRAARYVYVVSPGIEPAAVSVFNCSNIGFETRAQAEKYSRNVPGSHVYEVSFREIQ